MTGEKKPPIIKKVIKKGHGGHHGGSWKVAYADFVTAMMAFFLVMWLLAISSESGREALADYYNELTVYDAVFNGGIPSTFDERERPASILDGGCFAPRDSGNETRDREGEDGEMSAVQVSALLKSTQELLANLESLPEGTDGGEGSGDVGRGQVGDPAEAQAIYGPAGMSPEERQFSENLQEEIKASLGEAAAEQIKMEKVKGGLRIQIIDQEGRPTFRSGGAGLTNEGRDLINLVAQRLASIPNQISIEGHTDARPFTGQQKMTNWELSTATASATRLALAAGGVAESRLTAVTGYAATRPLPDTDPNDPVNRRVSVMIWDEEEPPASAPPASMDTPQGTAFSPPPLPKSGNAPNGRGRQSQKTAPPPPPKPLTKEELEQQFIDSVMEESATPDLSTVGPAFTPPPSD